MDINKLRQELKNDPPYVQNLFLQHARKKYDNSAVLDEEQIGKYLADIVIVPKLLIVEIDGESHRQRVVEDKHKDKYIKKLGLNIIRFNNKEVLENIGHCFGKISAHCPHNRDKDFLSAMSEFVKIQEYANKEHHLDSHAPPTDEENHIKQVRGNERFRQNLLNRGYKLSEPYLFSECPCGGDLKRHIARSGTNKGFPGYFCVNYPRCKTYLEV